MPFFPEYAEPVPFQMWIFVPVTRTNIVTKPIKIALKKKKLYKIQNIKIRSVYNTDLGVFMHE